MDGDASDFDFASVAPEDAVAYFRNKGYKIGFDWRDVWQEEHARGFTVAKAMTIDLLEDIRAVVDEAIADGIAFEDFQAKLEPILRARGWWGRQMMTDPLTGKKREVQLGSARRLQIIYDTNLRMSYSAGSWAQVQRTKKDLPYLRYDDPDPHPRPQHLDWSGTILPADDPWWDTHYPPNGWNCKCLVDSLSAKDIDRQGYHLNATAPPSGTYEYTNPRTGETSQVPDGISPGFAYNPGKAGLAATAEQMLAEKMATADPDIARAVAAIPAPPTPETTDPIEDAASVAWKGASSAQKKLRARMMKRDGASEILKRWTPDQLTAAYRYSVAPSGFNFHLRAGDPLTPQDFDLVRALNALPKVRGTVWRGEKWRLRPEGIAKYRKGADLLDEGFWSSSIYRGQAKKFAGDEGVIFRIESKTGHFIGPISGYAREREVLFAPRTAFRVKSAKRRGRKLYVVLEEIEK
ncbi:MAG TPA: phage minor head protein [Candidatus Binataceae bacterium]|nr:phage minor head protein [Candidatus Binataceae bacterium]